MSGPILKLFIAEQEFESILDKTDIGIQSSFDSQIQGSTETNTFTIVNEALSFVKNYIDEGLKGGTGIFEALPFEIRIQQDTEDISIFKGYIDPDSLEEIDFESKANIKVIKEDGLNDLSSKLEGLTFSFLESEGVITESDYYQVSRIVEKINNAIEVVVLGISIYLMVKELAEAVRRLADQIATIASILASGITGSVGSLIYATASVLFEAAYIAVMVNNLWNLVKQVQELLLPIPSDINGILLGTALDKIFSYLEYDFESPIEELNEYVYIPSKAKDRIDKGVPFDNDYGFTASEFVRICSDLFNAKLFVQKDGSGKSIVNLRSENDEFFESNSTFELPDVLEKAKKRNTSELKSSKLFTFKDDISDEYTINNWLGTSFLVKTLPVNVENEKLVTIRGFETLNFQVSLGNRKSELSTLEEALKAFFSSVDAVFDFFGQNFDSTDIITKRIGALKTSQEFFNNPKIVKVDGGKLSEDYRSGLSPKYLYEKYHNYNSFVLNNFGKQRLIYDDVEIPFKFSDYLKVQENAYFTTESGARGRLTSLDWNIESDTAVISYWIQETYTNNLKEEYFEAA